MENNPQNQKPAPQPQNQPQHKKKKLTSEEYARLCYLRSIGAIPDPKAGTSVNGIKRTGLRHSAVPSVRNRNRNGTPPLSAHVKTQIASKHTAPGSIYNTYKLVGGLSVTAIVLLIIIIALFSGNSPAAVPASAEGVDSTAEVTDDVTDSNIETKSIAASASNADNGKNVVCIDPGHGYDDPGAMYEKNIGDIKEKEITLAIALLLRDKLEEAGLTVVMTRSDDVIPKDADTDEQYLFNPFDRVDFVNAHPEVDLFLSLHCDAYTDDTSVGGTRIYYYNGGVEGTIEYAGALSASLGKSLAIDVPSIGKDYAEAYYVTKELSIPSVLIEMGFITNKTDAINLLSDKWRNTFVTATTQGILDYINSQG
jgi:N-acetylmuramoyl-L-alanine amidase